MGRSRQDLQPQRDVWRAQVLLARLRAITTDDAAVLLEYHAGLTGVSLHAAALSVLATTPSEPLCHRDR